MPSGKVLFIGKQVFPQEHSATRTKKPSSGLEGEWETLAGYFFLVSVFTYNASPFKLIAYFQPCALQCSTK